MILKNEIEVGVSIVAMIPDSRYSICSELYWVSTCHESDGLVENGFVILPSTIFNVVSAGVELPKQMGSSCRTSGDKFVRVQVLTKLEPMLKLSRVTVVVA